MDVSLLFDVGGTSVKAAAAWSGAGRGELIEGLALTQPTRAQGSRAQILADFKSALDRLWEGAAAAGADRLAGVGYAIAGPFDYERGISLIKGVGKYEAIYGVNLIREAEGWTRPLPRAEGFRIATRNDAAMFALGEATYGLARGVRRAMFLTLGTGAGSSFTVDGRLVTSAPDVPANGFIYDTPFMGSIIDDHVSRRGLLRLAAEAGLDTDRDVHGLADLARAGDGAARSVFWRFGEVTGRALRIWADRFHPQMLVIGGRIALAHALFDEALRQALPDIPVAYAEDSSRSAFLGLLAHLRMPGR